MLQTLSERLLDYDQTPLSKTTNIKRESMASSSKKPVASGHQKSPKASRTSVDDDDVSYQLALRLQQEEDERNGYVEPPKPIKGGHASQKVSKSSDPPSSSITLTKEIQEDIEIVQDLMYKIASTPCRSCELNSFMISLPGHGLRNGRSLKDPMRKHHYLSECAQKRNVNGQPALDAEKNL